ncbi:S9 family peptidase [Bacteroidota bacterium]
MKAPDAKKISKELSIHGDTRIDEYYWMKDRENPEVLEYLKAENEYTKELLKETEELQKTIYDEIVGRIKQTDMSVPYFLSGYYYYSRYEEGFEYPIYCRKMGSLENKEEIMLNVNEMAKGYDFYNVTGLNVSPDNNLISYGVDTISRRLYTIHIKNLSTGEIFTDAIPNTIGRAAWAKDNKTLFYANKDIETLRPGKIYRHIIGEDVKSDKLIFTEDDVTFNTYVFNSKSDDFIFIGSFSTLTTEYRFLDAKDPMGEFKLVQARKRDLEYSVSHFKNKFYIKTNYNAKNFRLMETKISSPGIEHWKEVIPHRDNVLLEDVEIFKNFLVLNERKDGLANIRVIGWENKEDYYIRFEDPTYAAYISTNPDFNTDILRYSYTSLVIPSSVYDYNMISKEKSLMKQQEVVGGYNSADYRSERVYATAPDGTKVPISMVYKTGTEMNGTNPLLLVGYGSYGSSYDPGFRSSRLSLIDRGFIYAIAHIRGGEDMGRQWYEDGKLLKKKNTFTDFIACGEYLIQEKYTNNDKLFALGGSAGGLLIGAVINMKPEIFKGAIAAVPFVDVITTMLDESIPLTTGEYDEWGDPNNKKYYDYMLSYSPYDNVVKQDYPALLVTTGWHDSQVQYWEPAKWVAKMRDYKTDNNELLLWTNLEYGHGGASGRFKRYEETAMEYAFLISLL